MTDRPQAARPLRTIERLGPDFYDPVEAADFPETILRFRNDRAAAGIGLDTLDDAAWLRHFGRFEPIPGSLPRPLALRYHGHQFRAYNPDIGDGRGFLFAQLEDARGRTMDLGTKGSGQTPYSRFGDGRLTLKGAVRELLATEMLEALGVETSRTLSIVETGESLHRGDEPSPTRSAVLVRLSHGHIRIGSFQRLAFLRDEAGLAALAGYCLETFFGEPADAGPARLVELVAERTGRLAASYMAAGFVHGVLNSDNINVTGESFDYGPWRFAPTWDPGFTAAYFDQSGLYAFGRQAEAIGWDLTQLALSLRPLVETAPLQAALDRYAPAFRDALAARLAWRLGVAPPDDDRAFVETLEAALRATQVPLDRFFFDWRGGPPAQVEPPFCPLADLLVGRDGARSHPYWSGPGPQSMLIDEVEAIWAAIAARDDWAPLHAKVAAIRDMGAALGLTAGKDSGRGDTGGADG